MLLWAIQFDVHISLTVHLPECVKMIAAFAGRPPRGIKGSQVFKTPLLDVLRPLDCFQFYLEDNNDHFLGY